MPFATVRLADDPDVIAPDGSEVRILCATAAGSMAHFTLPPGGISIAVAHRTIDEVWYFISGQGRMWRQDDDGEDIVEVEPGIAITIPLGARFQFRCDGDEPLTAVAIAMPPWPGADEAFAVEGPWQPNV